MLLQYVGNKQKFLHTFIQEECYDQILEYYCIYILCTLQTIKNDLAGLCLDCKITSPVHIRQTHCHDIYIKGKRCIWGVGRQTAEQEPAVCPGGQEDQRHPGLYQE